MSKGSTFTSDCPSRNRLVPSVGRFFHTTPGAIGYDHLSGGLETLWHKIAHKSTVAQKQLHTHPPSSKKAYWPALAAGWMLEASIHIQADLATPGNG